MSAMQPRDLWQPVEGAPMEVLYLAAAALVLWLGYVVIDRIADWIESRKGEGQ